MNKEMKKIEKTPIITEIFYFQIFLLFTFLIYIKRIINTCKPSRASMCLLKKDR